MKNKEASEILDDYDVNFEGHNAEEIAEAFDCAFKALEQIDKIKHIIAIDNSVIQEDIMKYKMICEVVEE